MNLSKSFMISNESLRNYYERSTCSVQYLKFIRSFAAEPSDRLSASGTWILGQRMPTGLRDPAQALTATAPLATASPQMLLRRSGFPS